MGRGKAKGGNYERLLCKRLSLWWTNGERDDVFWRSSSSGARATIRHRQGLSTYGQHGDIQAVDPIGAPLMRLVSIEAKRGYPKASVNEIVERRARKHGTKTELEIFFEQADRGAREAGVPFWWLIVQKDRCEELIYIPTDLFKELSTTLLLGMLSPLTRPRLRIVTTYRNRELEKLVKIDCTCLKLNSFLEWIDAKSIEMVLKLYHGRSKKN